MAEPSAELIGRSSAAGTKQANGIYSTSYPVLVERRGDIALIVIDRPPVNALNHDVRAGLLEAFKVTQADASVASVILTCARRTFVAGSDIAEFDRPAQFPGLPDVITVLDGMTKPVTAALFGTVLGGGLELALACHYRIATHETRLGLPEITLGLMPGAGGTQRLPRLIGMPKAMAMILTGKPISAAEAHMEGLVDEIVNGDVTDAAIAFAHRFVGVRPIPRSRDAEEKLQDLRTNPAEFDRFASPYLESSHDPEAIHSALAAMRSAIDTPIDEALRLERQSFIRLRESEKAKARRHIFFAERDSARIPDLPGDAPIREIKTAVVIGAGTMGSGIAMCFANSGIPVSIVENNADALQRGLKRINENYRSSVARGRLSQDEAERRLGRIQGSADLESASESDIVVEAAFEDIAVKAEIFRALDRVAKEKVILATNTSYLDVNAIAHFTRRPATVLGMHFFSPANVMRLVEIVRGAETAPSVVASAIKLAKKLGKIPVVVGVCHGFVGNRMMRVRSAEAERLLLEGAFPQDVDAALIKFGFPMGTFAMSDLAGLDVSWQMRKSQGATAPIADLLCEAGRFGQKCGKGFYRYEEGSRQPRRDPDVEQLIVATSAKLGIARRAFDPQEIVERLIFPMINEGARILDEGVAQQSSDIDVIWVHGYGFPAWRGGPMYFADRIGLRTLCNRLQEIAAKSGHDRHRPARLLAQLADNGGTFGSLQGTCPRMPTGAPS